jgi:hypothetical protein
VSPVGFLTRHDILDNITLCWLTGTGVSAAQNYWEDARALAAARSSGQPPPAVSVPVGFTTFPGEIWASPRSWVEAVYPGVRDGENWHSLTERLHHLEMQLLPAAVRTLVEGRRS